MDNRPKDAPVRRTLWQGWMKFGARHGRLAALSAFLFGALIHAVLSHVFATAHADEVEALLDQLYVFQCVPLGSVQAPALAARSRPVPTPLATQLRELDVTSVRVLLIERAVQGLGDHLEDAARATADVLRHDPDLNARAGAVLALSYMGAGAGPALPDLLDTLVDQDEDIRLRRLILDKLPDIDPSREAVAPFLAAMMESESDPDLRSKVAKALTEFGAAPDR